ncbi:MULTISPECIES: Stp1/IreP family PP2C-type Ser/Thr phosphatase [Solibacillus]|uniref:Stp1/IreP family PP2C-type Ser/Thr phosphatase n=1 Tax=Solibacillus merdavium TaxID=2762218 RepID=A0ABR8XIE0_9BACL|nr:Stp1/IreP family PP2C-type Ser/Thr phosphatase [Solibacillus merdavium]MBD8031704.1 Stp1/IreP family PP2C-type Ser/Thr phosphatase [Solibacillus merdavium]
MNFTVESDIGLKRKINEDRAAFFERPDHFKLAILADGMGGHNAGDVASEMAITEMHRLFKLVDAEDFASKQLKLEWLRNAVSHINQKIYQYSLTHENCQGMGTTMIAALLDENECLISHVGDSRVYHFADEEVKLVTRDHSYVNILLENGEISEEEAINHPQKNFILKALGTEISIEPDFYELTLSNEAYLLICSDGLSNKLTTTEMATIISPQISIEEKGKKLVQLANDRGGEDNISLILMTTVQEV